MYMKLSPYVRAKSCAAVEDIVHILLTPAVHYHFTRSPQWSLYCNRWNHTKLPMLFL